MWVVNESIHLTVNDKEKEVTFFNGEHFVVETSDQKLLRKIFNWYKEPRECNDFPLINGLSEDDVSAVVKELIEQKIIIEFNPQNSRLQNYYQTYNDNLIDNIHKVNILLIGCGTIGTSVAMSLVKMGFMNIDLIDSDVVSVPNVEAQAVFTNDDIGLEKGEVLANFLKKIAIGQNEINYYNFFLENISQLIPLFIDKKYDYVIDCSDEKSDKLFIDMIDFFDVCGTTYISTGYYEDKDFIFKVYNNYLEFKNFITEDFYRAESLTQYSKNRGVITDSMIYGAIIPKIIINDLIYPKTNDIVKYFDANKLEFNEFDLIFERENFLVEIGEKLSSIYTSEDIRQILLNFKNNNFVLSEIQNIAQFLQFTNDISMVEKTDNKENYKLFEEVFDIESSSDESISEFNKIVSAVSNDRTIKITNDIFNDMQIVNKFGSDTLQVSIYEAIGTNLENLLNLLHQILNQDLEDGFFEVSGIKKDIVKKLISDLSSISKDRYKRIQGSFDANILLTKSTDKSDIDYFDYTNIEEDFFGSKSKAIEFMQALLFNLNLDTFFSDMISSKNIIINPYSKNKYARVVNLTNTGEQILYIDYDGTYRALATLIHEFGHLYANQFMSEDVYWNETSQILNESLAESFVLSVLDIDDIDCFSEELKKLKTVIKFLFYRKIQTGISQIDFILKIKSLNIEEKILTKEDYVKVMNKIRVLDPEFGRMKNYQLFENNYLISSILYESREQIIQQLLTSIISVNMGNYIIRELKKGIIISQTEIDNILSLPLLNSVEDAIQNLKGTYL